MSDRRLRVIQRGDDANEEDVLAILDKPIRVVLPDGVPAWRHQLLALALVDLLGRLFPRIEIVVDPGALVDPLLPPGPALLAERLQAVRAHGCAPLSDDGEPAVTVRIGIGAGADVHVDGSGWQSYVGSLPSRLPERPSQVAVGPLVAACRAANQVFQLAIGDRLAGTRFRVESAYASALTLDASADPLEEAELRAPTELNAVLVGAGSIGGAAVYLFAHTPQLAGELDVVDDDTLKEHNPDRALLATEALCTQGARKAEVAAAALAHHAALAAQPHCERFEPFVAGRARDLPLPLVLSAVDSVRSRREIQDAVPLDVIDAACGVEQVSCSGHRTNDGPCIYCLHIRDVLDATRIKYRLLAQATGFPEAAIPALHVSEAPLAAQHVRAIEAHRRANGEEVPVGAFDSYIGRTLETLYRERFLYGEALVTTAGGGQAAVASPFVTALAGFMLAGEALKAAGGAPYTPYRLGPLGEVGTMYREDPWRTPINALITNPTRWPTPECLCRSPLRLRLLAARYTL